MGRLVPKIIHRLGQIGAQNLIGIKTSGSNQNFAISPHYADMAQFRSNESIQMTNFQKHRAGFRFSPQLLISIFMLLVAGPLSTPATAQTPDRGASGLPLPRFVSLSSDTINVRRGPGQRYDISWIYTQAGLPVEIIQESENWRKVRDSTGDEGWILKTLLSGRRTALVTPWNKDSTTSIFRRPENGAEVRAHLKGFVLVSLAKCEDSWCQISGSYLASAPDGGSARKQSFKGWIVQDNLWGVYPNESID